MGNNGSKTVFNYVQLIGDLLLVNIAIVLSFLIRFLGELPWKNVEPYLYLIPFISLLTFFIFNFYGLYQTAYKRWSEIFASVIISVLVLMVVTVSVSYMIGGFAFPRTVFFISAAMQILIITGWRRLLYLVERRSFPPRRIISVAPHRESGCIVGKLGRNYGTVMGTITDLPVKVAEDSESKEYPVLGSFENALKICRKYRPDAVIVSGAVPDNVKEELVHSSLNEGWEVFVVPGLYEIMISKTVMDQIEDTPVLKVNPTANNPGQFMVKRFMDVVISMVAMFILSPLMLATAMAIKISSRGPILYRQERIGIGGRHFNLYKFRTMYNDAEKDTGPVLATSHDERITRVGRFLRSTRIDEIPQIFNVLRGEMSLVGPRPERPFFVEQYEKDIPGYTCRHTTEAGITGLAQVMSNYSTSAEDKLRYDIFYTRNRSPLLDLKILLQTMKVILMKDRAS